MARKSNTRDGRVTIFGSVDGVQLEKALAQHDGVQRALQEHAAAVAADAKANLEAHRDTGDSDILLERGRIDRYVTLSDERGQLAALSIEFGRKEGSRNVTLADGSTSTVSVGGMEGLNILSKASRAKHG